MTTPDLNELVKKAEELQKKMKAAHDEVTSMRINGEAGGGMVRVVMNGRHEVIRIEVTDEGRSQDIEVLLDLIAAAFNNASNKIEAAAKDKMVKLAKDLGLPEQGGAAGGASA